MSNPKRREETVTTAFAILFYAATALLVAGLGARIARFWRTPSPLKIATTPAPLTQGGAWFRVAREIVVFESLFKSNKPLWIMAALFHFGLFVVLARHVRYFQDQVWLPFQLVQPFAVWAGLAMMGGLALLAVRRAVVPRIKAITGPSDWLMLALLLAIAVTGMAMKGRVHTDIVAVKAYFLGLMRFEILPLPADPLLYAHLALVAALMIVFPFSKLLHVPGIFFSPTRHQADDPRERRHLSAWAAKLEGK